MNSFARLNIFKAIIIVFAFFLFMATKTFAGPIPKGESESFVSLANGSIRWNAQLDNRYYQEGRSNEHFLYIQIKGGKTLSSQGERAPLNIALVLDRSGSMSGEKIRYARDAAHYVIDQLHFGDYLSIVNYDEQVEVSSYSQPVRNKALLHRAVDEITDRGSTNLMGGTLKGYEQVWSTRQPGYIHRVLLLTDGLANVGITDPLKMKNIIGAKFQEQNTALSTFGVGADYNEDLLTMMAETGRGNYYFIDRPNRIPGIFAQELHGLLNVVAKNTTLNIQIPYGLSLEQVYGATTERGSRHLSIHLSDIYAEQERAVVIKFRSSPYFTKGEIKTTLSFYDTKSKQNISSKIQNTFFTTKDAELISRNKNLEVENNVIMYRQAEQMDIIMKDVDNGDYAGAREKTIKSIKVLQDRQAVAPSAELKKQEEQMKKYAEDLKRAETMGTQEKSIMQKSNKAANYNLKNKR